MKKKLDSLVKKYPLEGWSEVQLYTERMHIGSLEMDSIGLSTLRGGRTVTSSAAGIDSNVVLRAYFELMERTSIVLAEEKGSAMKWPLYDSSHIPCGIIDHSSLFLESKDPASWKYSRSNGAAAHVDFRLACAAGLRELKERDTILRSWYFGPSPTKVPGCVLPLKDLLAEDFETEAYHFGPLDFGEVVAVVGFPRCPKKNPAFMGFGCGKTFEAALQHASNEAIQRLAFTWGEELTLERPLATPDPEFHLNYYLYPDHLAYLRSWLNEKAPRKTTLSQPVGIASQVKYADLTPSHLLGKAVIVRALSESYMPLTFGGLHPWVESGEVGSDLPHPIA